MLALASRFPSRAAAPHRARLRALRQWIRTRPGPLARRRRRRHRSRDSWGGRSRSSTSGPGSASPPRRTRTARTSFPTSRRATTPLNVEFEGFKTVNQTGITLETGYTRTINIQMEIGQLTEVITVEASTPLPRIGDPLRSVNSSSAKRSSTCRCRAAAALRWSS